MAGGLNVARYLKIVWTDNTVFVLGRDQLEGYRYDIQVTRWEETNTGLMLTLEDGSVRVYPWSSIKYYQFSD